MSEPARNRFALDLEDLERQLRSAGQAPRPGQSVDPLAELTRIVGQDDPLKDIFAPKPREAQPRAGQPQAAAAPSQPTLAWPPARREPAFEQHAYDEPAYAPQQPAARPPAEIRGALDEFEALMRRSDARAPDAVTPAAVRAPAYLPEPEYEPEPQTYARQAAPAPSHARDLDDEAGRGYAPAQQDDYGAYQDQYAPHDQAVEEDYPDLEPRRSRKGLWTAAALVAIGIIGVGGAMTMRGGSQTADGQPPLIAADEAPVKIEPVNPGGTEIPNQNKQIYERAGSAAPAAVTKVVSQEEQPIDVQQTARLMQPRVVMPGPGATPPNGDGADTINALANAPIAPDAMATPAEPALTAVPPVPGLGEPRRVRTVSIRPDGTVLPPASANGVGVNTAAAVPAPMVTGSTPQPRPRPAAVPEAPKAQERAASANTPVQLARAAPAEAPAAAPATAAIRAGTGDFTVQLAAPGSESEARATFSGLQKKYAGILGGQKPIVRRTDLAGGKTVYRLRVGPFSREDATTMCTQLQAAGGQCFIAKN